VSALLAPALSGLMLSLLAATNFRRPVLAAALLALPVIFWLAPSPTELGLTVVVEAPVVTAITAAFGLRAWRAGAFSLFVNGLTQPLLHLALTAPWATTLASWRVGVAAGETIVWLVEAALYFACLADLRRAPAGFATALLTSFAANAASTGLGLALSV